MKSVAVFLSAILVVSFLPIYAAPEASEQDKFNWADVIVTGKITTYSKPEPPPIVTSGYPLTPDDIPAITGSHGCPSIQLEANMVGYSGATVQYHEAKPLPGR